MCLRVFAFTVFLLASALVDQSRADDAWTWNPFAASETKATAASASAESPSALKAKNTSRSDSEKKKADTFKKLSKATKAWRTKTAAWVAPYPKEASTPRSKANKKSDGWSWNIFSKKEKQISTMAEWWDLPKP